VKKHKPKKTPVYLKYEFDTPEFRAKQPILGQRQRNLKKRATPQELRIKGLLDEMNIRHNFQKGFIAFEYFCIVDFYIPGLRLCLEIDGGHHYTDSAQIAKDARRTAYLTDVRGFKVHRMTNKEAEVITAIELYDLLRGFGKFHRKDCNLIPERPLDTV